MEGSLIKQKKLVLIGEAAKFLGVSIDTVRRWDKNGTLNSSRPGGKNRYFAVSELEEVKHSQPLSISEAARKLEISEVTLRRLDDKGIIKLQRNENGERVFSSKTLENFINSEYFLRRSEIEQQVLASESGDEGKKKKLEPAKEHKIILSQHKILSSQVEDQNRKLSRLIVFRRAIAGLVIVLTSVAVSLVILFSVLYILRPQQTARWFGLRTIWDLSTNDDIANRSVFNDWTFSLSSKVAELSNGEIQHDTVIDGKKNILADALKPISSLSLGVVKQLDLVTYYEIVPANLIEDVNDVFAYDEGGNLLPRQTIVLPSSAYLQVPDSGLIANLNADYIRGKVPGTNPGDIAYYDGNGKISNSSNELDDSSAIAPLSYNPDTNKLSFKYDSNNLAVSDGKLTTVQGLSNSSNPQFAGLTIGGINGILIATNGNVSTTTDNSTDWDTAFTHITNVNNPHNVTSTQILPDQTGQTGRVLGTNGTTVSWVINSAAVSWGGILGTLSNQVDLQAALNAKENSISAGLNSQYWRGDKTWQTLNSTAVGLGSVENTALSTWAGSTNITTLGTIGTGTWNATAIADGKIASALTGKTYNGLTLTANATGFSIIGGTISKTLTLVDDTSLSGTNTGDQDLSSYALKASTLAQFASTTSLQLAGVISDETGSGALVFATSPTLVTPNIGVATGTSLSVTDSIWAGTLAPTNPAKFYALEEITDHAHYAFLDESVIEMSGVGTQGHASFDANITIQGTEDFAHHNSFQSTPHYDSTGTLDSLSNFYAHPYINSGTVDKLYSFTALDPLGSGTINELYGLYIHSLTRGNTNWGVFLGDNVNQYIGGDLYDKGNVRVGYYGSGNRGLYIGSPGDEATILYNASTGNLDIAPRSGYKTIFTAGSVAINSLTASQAIFTDASKNLVSNAITGTGSVVMSTSPTLTTPTLGIATATSINKVAITAPATGATLTIADGKTLTASNTLTLSGTDSSSVAFGAGGTVAYTSGTLAQFSATTSLQLAGVISDETGSGALAFATSPTLVTPNIGVATGTSLAIGANTLDTNEWALLDGQDQALKTSSSPYFTKLGIGGSPTYAVDAFGTTPVIRAKESSGTASYGALTAENDLSHSIVVMSSGSTMAGTIMGVTRADTGQIYTNSQALTIGTVGAYNLTLGTNNMARFIIDSSGHLTMEGVTSTGATGTGALVFGTSPTLSLPTISGGTATLSEDTNFVLSGGVNGLSFDSTTLSIDATNHRVGIGTAAPGFPLDVSGYIRSKGDGILVTQATPANSIVISNATSGQAKIYVNTAQPLTLGSNSSTTQLVLASDGSVSMAGVLQTGGYKSSDGTAGLSLACNANKGIKSVTTKNGLITAATCTTNDLTDIAENYGTTDASIEAGDVVATSSTKDAQVVNTADGVATKAYVEKASSQNAGTTIGIVSENPQITLGEELFSASENPRPVALSGRVQVKVNNENGVIKKGDLISISSVAGIAAKASNNSEVTIGTALEDFNGASGKIIVFVNISHRLTPAVISQVVASGAIKADTLTVDGDAIFKGVIRGNDKFAGSIVVPAGQTKVRIARSWESTPSSVVVTPSFQTTSWVSQIDQTGFTINFGNAAEDNESVSFVVIFPTNL